MKDKEEVVLDGEVTEKYLDGYNKIIQSKDIIHFEYETGEYKLFCEKKEDKLQIKSEGGYSNERDGSYFKLDYLIDDFNILEQLQKIIESNDITKNNGYYQYVAGLEPIYGDTLKVTYKSNEEIYISSNQFHTIEDKISSKFYKLFLEEAKKNGYDFNSEKSNVKLYDDAKVEFLQGTWKGEHFGDSIEVVIKENHIKIYINNKITDDTEYTIIQGSIRQKQLKDNIEVAKDEYDYKEFEGVSSLRKKNEIMLVAYFTKDSYSTADLLKEN